MMPYGAGLNLYFESEDTKNYRLKRLFDFIKKHRPNSLVKRIEEGAYKTRISFKIYDKTSKNNYEESWYNFNFSDVFDKFVTTVFLDVNCPNKINHCKDSQRNFIDELIENGFVDYVDYWYGKQVDRKWFFQKKYENPTVKGFDFAVYLYCFLKKNNISKSDNKAEIVSDIRSLLKKNSLDLKGQSKIVTFKQNDCSILETLNSNFTNELKRLKIEK